MSSMFGVVNRPMFDDKVFEVNQAIHVVDYKKGLEYPGIITLVNPVFLDVLYYDVDSMKGLFNRIYVEDFIEGFYEFKGMVKKGLEEIHEVNTDKDQEDVVNSEDGLKEDLIISSSDEYDGEAILLEDKDIVIESSKSFKDDNDDDDDDIVEVPSFK